MSDSEPPWDLPTGELPTGELPTGEFPTGEFPTGEVTRPNSHRAEEPDRPLASRLLAPLGAVAVVVAVIVALILINGHNPTSAGEAVVTPGIHPSGLGPSGPLGATPTAPAHHHHKHGSGSASPEPSLTPTSTATAPPAAAQTDAVPTAMASVQVLNNSRIHGLAHEVAAEVEAKGWTVTEVGNLPGVVAESTVYYSPGHRAAARHLAREFSAVQRVLPAREAGLTATGLTLVLTRYWTG